MASLFHKLLCTPITRVYITYATGWAEFGIKQTKWALPATVGGLWFIFPAFTFEQEAASEKQYKFEQEEVGTPPQLEGGEDREGPPAEYVFESSGIGVPPQLA